MTNDPSSGDQSGWPGPPAYPGYGQQRGDQPGYGSSSYPPSPPSSPPPSYGQAPPWAAPAAQPTAQGASSWPGAAAHGAYPAGLGPGGGLPPTSPQNFFGALFDFGFNSFATPVVIKALYILSLIGIGLVYLIAVISGFSRDPLSGLVALVVGGVVALLTLIYTRVLLELIYAVVRIAEDVRVVRDRQQ